MINESHLREYVIRPALTAINKWSESAEELLVLTCAQESLGGTYLHQLKGPALGIFQMEPNTYTDIWERYLPYRPELVHSMLNYLQYSRRPGPEVMVYNLSYAAFMCRIHYLRVSDALPKAEDALGLAKYWNEHYNCNPSKGTDREAVENYLKFTGKTLKGVLKNGKVKESC